MVMLFSRLNLQISWACARVSGSLWHFRVTVWLPKLPSQSATRFAIPGAALAFPGTAIARISPNVSSTPVHDRVASLIIGPPVVCIRSPCAGCTKSVRVARRVRSAINCEVKMIPWSSPSSSCTVKINPHPSTVALTAARAVKDVSLDVLLHILARRLVLTLLNKGLLPSSACSSIDSTSPSSPSSIDALPSSTGAMNQSHRHRNRLCACPQGPSL